MKKLFLALFALASLVSIVQAQSNTIKVEIRPGDVGVQMDSAARKFGTIAARLTDNARKARTRSRAALGHVPYSMPGRIVLTKDGRAINNNKGRAPGPITLSFDASGSRAFTPSYQALLQSVFNTAQSTMDTVFGGPQLGGVVHVANYDADIGDRQAVAGGFYVPDNGSGVPEIRFPVYSNPEAAAVNFVHTLLLAYQGNNVYAFDAFQEGLVRAATMRVVRTPGAMPNTLDASQIETVLQSSYDTGGAYDWYNQRALSGPQFIAPNLLASPLPAGGSTGGLYLLRYEMSGDAWQKVLEEYPGFIAALNVAAAATPGLASDVPALISKGQVIIDAQHGAGSKVEGRTFADWYAHQYVLDTNLTGGTKLLCDPVPITSGLLTGDFGVFIVQANAFSTDTNGNETLLSGSTFPIFLDAQFLQVFTASQDERMDFAGGYSSVVPNFPGGLFNNQAYRVTADVPFQDRLSRVYLPAGAIAIAGQSTPNDFYGTISGTGEQSGDIFKVAISVNGSNVATLAATNGAFGTLLGTQTYLGYSRIDVTLTRTRGGSDTVLLTRQINKGPGPLAVDLRVNADVTQAFTLSPGIVFFGLSGEPLTSSFPNILGLTPDQTLAARFNPGKSSFDLFPNLEAPTSGHGYFARVPGAVNVSVPSTTYGVTPTSVALRPGWNIVTTPCTVAVAQVNISVIRANNFAETFSSALGTDLGTDIFVFQRGPNDAGSGVPETGTLVAGGGALQPNQAYYIQVLAAEGVTLLFSPPSGSSIMRAFEAPPKPRKVITWEMAVSIKGGGRQTTMNLGTTPLGSSRFLGRYDSALPPGMGGLQVFATDKGRIYTDIRPSGNKTNGYNYRVEGLIPGQTYHMNWSMVQGDVSSILLQDIEANTQTRMDRGRMAMGFTFVAKKSFHDFRLVASGSGR